ncbi:MAG: GntR family transcriptional regulator, partial [Myxococcales bacterium]|nr:GntR family transcriptional regulator [Myxococcales bacterium]
TVGMEGLKLNASLGVPIYRQVMDGIREMIAAGVLKPGDRLPSIRELAGAMRINPSSAVKAYNELKHAGVIVLDQGRGTFVAERPGLVAENREALLRADLEALLVRARARGFSEQQVARALKAMVAERKDGS